MNGDTNNLEEYTDSVTGCISKCIKDITVSKDITTKELCMLLKITNAAFRSADRAALRVTRAILSSTVRRAKLPYAQRINQYYISTKDTHCMWQGIQAITNYKASPHSSISDASPPK